ncbi:hypothetical protein GGI25_003648 [Coemansia spiralis]|uniref:Carbohydrate-binding module family 96 domain-containing protein n=2 Tax=Coemansia TaxID=4863 RepID=A0A9W8G6D5_9FUNG|nr:hypothetical protein BX070DRAFT_107287 [Coemansia spiralis]KAJ1996122.1 hypothetical protein EDC05_000012 [Coemansia umbellata]KAJ2626120.1 hypothetical protein GGI26_000204 [Coemansia sp. RSA 1358]KAJ2676261.1 hypothetical protein GGI25_003648 [Coemansia spiralis]
MKIFAVTAALVALVSAETYSAPVTNDVGLVYSNLMCGSTTCPTTNLSGQSQYTAFLGNRDYRRILMSFDLPADATDTSRIASCTLMLPQPITSGTNPSSYTLRVSPVTSQYDAKTVAPVTAPKTGDTIATATNMDNVAPAMMDITDACKSAINGQVGIVLDSSGGPVTFPSSNGGSTAKIMVTTY